MRNDTIFALVIGALIIITAAACLIGADNSATVTAPAVDPPFLAAAPVYSYPDRDNTDAVSELQNRLRELGYYAFEVTGVYDELTAAAVEAFQTAYGLPVTGIADEMTLDALFMGSGR